MQHCDRLALPRQGHIRHCGEVIRSPSILYGLQGDGKARNLSRLANFKNANVFHLPCGDTSHAKDGDAKPGMGNCLAPIGQRQPQQPAHFPRATSAALIKLNHHAHDQPNTEAKPNRTDQ